MSMALVLVWGLAGCGGGSPGQPTTHAKATTIAAVTALVAAATNFAEIARTQDGRKGHEEDLGKSQDLAFASPSPSWFCPDTSEASRSMVGGGRFARPEFGDESSGLSSSIPQFLFGLAGLESELACLSCAFWHKPAVVVQKFSSVAPQVRQENFGAGFKSAFYRDRVHKARS